MYCSGDNTEQTPVTPLLLYIITYITLLPSHIDCHMAIYMYNHSRS